MSYSKLHVRGLRWLEYVAHWKISLQQCNSSDIFVFLDCFLFYTDHDSCFRGKLPCDSCRFPEPKQGPAITVQLPCSQSEFGGSCCWSHNCSSRSSLSLFRYFEGFGIPNQPLRKTMHVSFFISCTASLLSLSALALDRYVAITYPLFYRSKLNAKRSLLVSAGVWTVSVSLSMIYFAVGYDKFRFVFANTAVVVTFVVLLFTNSKIFKFLRAQVKQWDNLHDNTEENLAKKQAIKWEKKITKTLVIVLMLFLAFYLPSCICIYIINFCANCNCVFIHWVRDIQFVLMLTNSEVNSFVYALRLDNFRRAFKNILTCRACMRRLRSISVNLLQISTSSTEGTSNTTTAGVQSAESVEV